MSVLGALLINGQEIDDTLIEEGGDLWQTAKLEDEYYEFGSTAALWQYF